MTNSESNSQCPHPPESEAVLNRDGALYVVCLECKTEIGLAPEITQIAAARAAPCGSDIPHRWGSPL